MHWDVRAPRACVGGRLRTAPDGTEEARIGADMDMHRLIGLHIVAPEMTTLVKARETDTEAFETARAA